MAEVLLEFAEPVIGEDGTTYTARACGDAMHDGRWQGWIEFVPEGNGKPVRSTRETTQPGREDTRYWASGLTPVFLQGSLRRALNPLRRPFAAAIARPIFAGPAPAPGAARGGAESILNPFSVYRKGEPLLRRQLAALSRWHLTNIISAYGLGDGHAPRLRAAPPAALIDLIVDAVRAESRTAR